MKKVIFNLDSEKCKGCALCTETCPKKIMEINSKTLNHNGYNPAVNSDPDVCIGCGNCAVICPEAAISIYVEE